MVSDNNLKILSKDPVDERLLLTKEQMLKVDEASNFMPDRYLVICADSPKPEIYLYDKSNVYNSEGTNLGKFRLFAAEEGGGESYTAGDAISISADNKISVNVDDTTIKVNDDNKLELIGGTSTKSVELELVEHPDYPGEDLWYKAALVVKGTTKLLTYNDIDKIIKDGVKDIWFSATRTDRYDDPGNLTIETTTRVYTYCGSFDNYYQQPQEFRECGYQFKYPSMYDVNSVRSPQGNKDAPLLCELIIM